MKSDIEKAADNPSTSDLILNNANIITLDPICPRAEMVVIRGGKVQSVGNKRDLGGIRKRNTKVVDCSGKTVLPGFIDAHCHFNGIAESFVTLNLGPHDNVHSISAIQSKIRTLSQQLPSGAWIRGRGFDKFYLSEKRYPTRWDLDAGAPLHPVRLNHYSGRAHVLNSLALKLVGISKETADPPEGLIERDMETGEPTGLLYGMGDYLAKVIPPIDPDQMAQGVKLASQGLSSFGITSIQDASARNDLKRWGVLQTWNAQGLLKPRVTMMVGVKTFNEHRDHPWQAQRDDNQLRLGGVKIMVHETTGQLSPSQTELNEMVLNIHRSGLQAVLHAIEEKTIEAASNAIEHALQRAPRPDHRHRIEHCSVCPPSLAKRLAFLGIIVVTQPSFLFYNGDRYLKTVPDSQLEHLYPIGTLMRNGVKVAGSSDCPVVPANPLAGIYSAISRRSEMGALVLPEEGITPMEAVRMYTSYAAETSFEEMIKGTITPGKSADLVVLNGDPTRLPVSEIKDIEVEMTIINGEVVWDKMA